MIIRIIFFLIILSSLPAFATIDIVICYSEAIVFASDSRTVNDSTRIIISERYEKIVKVTNYNMMMMQGATSPDCKNFKALIDDFKSKYNVTDSSSISADSLSFLFAMYCRAKILLGAKFRDMIIITAGINKSGDLKCYELKPSKQWLPNELANWRIYEYGINNTTDRILSGIDPIFSLFMDNFIDKYCEESQKIEAKQKYLYFLDIFNLRNFISLRNLPLSEIIELAYSLVKISSVIDNIVGGQYFQNQPNAFSKIGGRIMVCYVNREGVHWVFPPDYEPSWRDKFIEDKK